ncbi:hypothetical protein [Kitasatospora sp. NPDC057198]|uniref:hypothetical protein n=1 Tax=Kitasatospora sp. NPDC057198 TaxID=3346046 RepID=UPI00362EAFDA
MDGAVRVLALRYFSGWLESGELPMAAAELLADGYDSAALCDLAGRARREDVAELESLLREAVAESGLRCPDVTEAGSWRLARLAGQLEAGAINPGEFCEAVGAGPETLGGGAEDRLFAVLAEYCDCCGPQAGTPAYREWGRRVREAASELAAGPAEAERPPGG